MQKRKFDELISYFNRKVADMDIDTNYKMELLGMVTALGYAHEKETEERKKGKWLLDNKSVYEMRFVCSECHESEVVPTIGFTTYKPIWDYCPNCGARMEGES